MISNSIKNYMFEHEDFKAIKKCTAVGAAAEVVLLVGRYYLQISRYLKFGYDIVF